MSVTEVTYLSILYFLRRTVFRSAARWAYAARAKGDRGADLGSFHFTVYCRPVDRQILPPQPTVLI